MKQPAITTGKQWNRYCEWIEKTIRRQIKIAVIPESIPEGRIQ